VNYSPLEKWLILANEIDKYNISLLEECRIRKLQAHVHS